MSKPLKIVLVLAAVVVAGFLALGIAVTALFDPNDYRAQIVDAVSKGTGRPFELEGELGLEFFPCCAISVGPARLGNPAGFPTENFAQFLSAAARIRIWPLLLRREIEIGTFRIDGLELHLLRLADGRGNWRFSNDSAAQSAERPGSGSAMGRLRMESIDATGARLRYQDLQAGAEYAATDVHVHSGAVLFQDGTLAIDSPDLALIVTGAKLPNAQMTIGLTAERLEFASDAGTMDLRQFAMGIDESTMTGNAAIGEDGQVVFDAAIDRLNLDAYLPRAEPDAATAASATAPTRIPVETIRRLHIDGRLRAGELTLLKTRLTNVAASLKAADGLLRIDPLAADLYGGQFRGTASIDARGPQATLAIDHQVAGVQVGDLLRTRLDKDVLSGALSLSLAATGSGATTEDVLRGLNGTVVLDLADGIYHGTDFLYEIRRAAALLKQRAPPPAPATRQTPINTLRMTGRLVDGVMKSDWITAEVPAMHVGGKGDLDLTTRLMNYRMKAELVAAPDGSGDDELADLAGKSIPFTVKGPANSPRVKVDLDDLLKNEAQGALERGLRKLFRRSND